jgi:hypothetical protein
MVDEMHDGLDMYIGRSLKNWSAKQTPRATIKMELLRKASFHPSVDGSPIALFLSSFANRWASHGDQLYSQRQWQFSGPYVRPVIWSNHFISQLRMVQ